MFCWAERDFSVTTVKPLKLQKGRWHLSILCVFDVFIIKRKKFYKNLENPLTQLRAL